MEINVVVYKLSQRAGILPLFKRTSNEEFNEFLAVKEEEYRAYSVAMLLMSALQMAQSCMYISQSLS